MLGDPSGNAMQRGIEANSPALLVLVDYDTADTDVVVMGLLIGWDRGGG
jgi:hypothetical protein